MEAAYEYEEPIKSVDQPVYDDPVFAQSSRPRRISFVTTSAEADGKPTEGVLVPQGNGLYSLATPDSDAATYELASADIATQSNVDDEDLYGAPTTLPPAPSSPQSSLPPLRRISHDVGLRSIVLGWGANDPATTEPSHGVPTSTSAWSNPTGTQDLKTSSRTSRKKYLVPAFLIAAITAAVIAAVLSSSESPTANGVVSSSSSQPSVATSESTTVSFAFAGSMSDLSDEDTAAIRTAVAAQLAETSSLSAADIASVVLVDTTAAGSDQATFEVQARLGDMVSDSTATAAVKELVDMPVVNISGIHAPGIAVRDTSPVVADPVSAPTFTRCGDMVTASVAGRLCVLAGASYKDEYARMVNAIDIERRAAEIQLPQHHGAVLLNLVTDSDLLPHVEEWALISAEASDPASNAANLRIAKLAIKLRSKDHFWPVWARIHGPDMESLKAQALAAFNMSAGDSKEGTSALDIASMLFDTVNGIIESADVDIEKMSKPFVELSEAVMNAFAPTQDYILTSVVWDRSDPGPWSPSLCDEDGAVAPPLLSVGQS